MSADPVKAALTPELRLRLVEAAKRATSGPWKAEGTIYEHMAAEVRCTLPGSERGIAQVWDHPQAFADAQFMALADPTAVLAFDAALAAAEAGRDEMQARWEHCKISLAEQSAARQDPTMPLLAEAVLSQLEHDAEAQHAMAGGPAERIVAHGLGLLCEWQRKALALLSPQAAPAEQGEDGDPEDFPDALTGRQIRQLAARNMSRLCRDDDDAFFLNGSAVGVTSGGGGSQVAECDDEGIAAIVCTALMDLYCGRMAQVISLIRLARTEEDAQVRDAALHAALDFATNDEEALAEGRLWAAPAEQKDGA